MSPTYAATCRACESTYPYALPSLGKVESTWDKTRRVVRFRVWSSAVYPTEPEEEAASAAVVVEERALHRQREEAPLSVEVSV